jgi:hypothetical protein
MKAGGHKRVEYVEVAGRDHRTIVSRIPEPDDVVARAIVAFINAVPEAGSSSR